MPDSPPWEELQNSLKIKNQSPSVFPWAYHAAYPKNDEVIATPFELHKIPKKERKKSKSPVSEAFQALLELHKSPKSEGQMPFEHPLNSREKQKQPYEGYPPYPPPNNNEDTATPIKLHEPLHSPKIDYNKSPIEFDTYQNPKLENQSPIVSDVPQTKGGVAPQPDPLGSSYLNLHNSPPKEYKSPFGMQHSPLGDNQSSTSKMHQSTSEAPLYPTYPKINAGIPKIIEIIENLRKLRNTVKKTTFDAIATKEFKKLRLKRQADSKKDELETFGDEPKEVIGKEGTGTGTGTAPVLTCPVRQEPHGNRKGDQI
ncbi:Hypothetical predicted protein [Drosophila guanche]|uniref:Uncharacterized protein n=1 Tax=Drosophila guanche TaxID=7266 RepID=A0A3B0KKE4_DROGU|nr:Hypothetical predicted protein [Drosophila guanche]